MDLWEEVSPGPGGGFSFLRCRIAVITCLNRLSCQICSPPPEVPDACRLLVAFALFGGAATVLAATGRLGMGVTIYCTLGWARLIPQRVVLLAVVLVLAAANWFLSPTSWPFPVLGPALLVAASELCWIRTMQKVLDCWFESFVAIMFLYLGIVMVFAFYPALLRFGPDFMTSSALSNVFHSAASNPTDGSAGVSPHFGSEDFSSGAMALTSVIPLLAIVLGVPLLSVVILIYCWMCHYMSRMVKAVVLTFCLWLLLYGGMILLHVPFSRDFFGKGLLVSVCIVMYSAFARLATLDLDACEKRRRFVFAGYGASLLIDAFLGAGEGEVCVLTLFIMLCGCKIAFASCENAIDIVGEGDADFRLSFLSPMRPGPKEHRADAGADSLAANADPAEGLPESSYEMMDAASAEEGMLHAG